jgi:hypothetical protein
LEGIIDKEKELDLFTLGTIKLPKLENFNVAFFNAEVGA